MRALNAPVEASIRDLLTEYGYGDGDDLLQGLTTVSEVLEEYGISCSPPLGSGDLDAPRILASQNGTPLSSVLSEIGHGESSDVEFKASLLIDTKKLAYAPGKPLHEYKSDEVIRSALKTIAAFANSGGGTLYLGVTDDGDVCGLEDDFAAASPKRQDYDGWDLHFRNLIGTRLSDGSSMNRYVQTNCYEASNGRRFVRARIASRSRLTFLRTGEAWELFVRSGTQTNSIPYAEIEQHFMLKPLY